VPSKLSRLCVAFVCFLGTGLSLWGQNTSSVVHGIPGYLNPQTGAFHPLPQPEAQDSVEPPATTMFGGKFVVNFTITVDSVIASTNKIGCQVAITLEDTATVNFIEESAGVAVTRGTGSTVTCTVTIPYSWKLASASTDSVSLTYSITNPVEISTPAGEFPLRTSSQSIGTIKVPVNGATTTETVTATI
jgi:hypothetical protein